MPELQPYHPSLIEQRRSGRALSRLAADTGIAIASTEARTEIEAAIVDGIAYIGTRAMQQVALVSQIEQSLAQAVPHASGRLATIADLAAVGMAEAAASAGRRIGRR
jgi:hypothetical protein